MKYRYLGNTGVQVSELCMGTMTFGRESDEAESKAMFNRCLEAGINFFDCANVYSQGRAEIILGKLIQANRQELIITSKFGSPMGTGLNDDGASRRNLTASLEASLRRLQTDYLDLYFLHRFDEYTPIEETLRALDDVVAQGKVRFTGVSNFAAWQVARALGVSERYGWTPLHCIQPMYSLVKRQAEVEILPLAQSENMAVISYNPLGGGILSGKYGRQRNADQGRLMVDDMYQKRYRDQWMYDAAMSFVQLSIDSGFHPVSLAIAWVARHAAITAPIVGARNVAQLNDALNSVDINIEPELYDAICDLTPTPPPATDRTETRVAQNDA